MKIKLSKDEYRLLLDSLTLAGMVLDSYDRGRDERRQPYFELEQKLYALHEEGGAHDLVERDRDSGQYVRKWTPDRSEEVVEFYDTFVDDSFWDELIIRMCQRDLQAFLALEGREESSLSLEERRELIERFESRYHAEFHSRGLDDLVLRSETAEGAN